MMKWSQGKRVPVKKKRIRNITDEITDACLLPVLCVPTRTIDMTLMKETV